MKAMQATPFTHPGFTLMKQTDIQSFFHMQMPRWLFTDTRYNVMSLEAKVAYTFLLNRFQLSKLNGWINADGEVFIIYTRSSLADEMQVSYRKVISSMKELAASELIYERRCGRGDANQIYLAKVELTGEHDSGNGSAPFVPEESRSADMACLEDGGDVGTADAEPDAEPVSEPRHADMAHQDMQDTHPLMCENGTSRDAGTAHQDMQIRHSSNTDVNYTEISDIDRSQSVSGARGRDGPGGDELQELDDILDGCELWTFPDATARVFENAIERLFFSEKFKIGGAVLPRKKIRSHLHQLDSVRLQDAVSKLADNKERKIKNSTAYVMAVVFNSIWEADSDILCDPYLNSLEPAPPLPLKSRGDTK